MPVEELRARTLVVGGEMLQELRRASGEAAARVVRAGARRVRAGLLVALLLVVGGPLRASMVCVAAIYKDGSDGVLPAVAALEAGTSIADAALGSRLSRQDEHQKS